MEEAALRFPEALPIRLELARTLAALDRIDAALGALAGREAEREAAALVLHLLAKAGRTDEAAGAEAALRAADPGHPILFLRAASGLAGQASALLDLAERALAARPGDLDALYWKAVALVRCGRAGEAEALLSFDRFVHAAPLALPAGCTIDAVRAEILANPTLHRDPQGHAMVAGLRTRPLPGPGDRIVPVLLEAIVAAIDDYARALGGDHPFVRARPARARFVAWALVFRGEGRQRPHRHPGRWLTGVFYVAAPAGRPRPGALRIGAFDPRDLPEPPWPPRAIEPEPGLLVLFPSYVPHDTLPTGSDRERIAIAFDVVPIDG